MTLGLSAEQIRAIRAAQYSATAPVAAKSELEQWKAEYNKTKVPGYTVAPDGPLTARGKKLQEIVLRRDWDALFNLIPVDEWPRHWMLGKYSFRDVGGRRIYEPFTKEDIRSFVFSPYYTVQPGWECTDYQRELGVEAHWKAQQTHQAKFGETDWRSNWPIYPGGGYGDQTYGCEKDVSWWSEHRGKVWAAVGAVAAVALGPAIIGSISGGGATATGAAATGTGAGTAATTTGIVGAGAKAGAITTTVTAKAGAAAAATKAAGAAAAISGAAQSGSLFQTTQNLVGVVNKARTVDALIKGELPPPPISITGSNFTEWALDIAKQEVKKEISERAGEYVTEKMQEQMVKEQEAKMRAEIEAMQRELAALVPPGTKIEPSPQLTDEVRKRIQAMQEIERQREQQTALAIAAGIGALLLMAG